MWNNLIYRLLRSRDDRIADSLDDTIFGLEAYLYGDERYIIGTVPTRSDRSHRMRLRRLYRRRDALIAEAQGEG